jgi:hypothetical protein
MAERLIMVADTWGHEQARLHEELTMLTKSRWQLTKSSEGAGGLGDRVVEDNEDMCRESGGGIVNMHLQAVWWFEPQNHELDGFWVWASKLGWSFGGNWRHHMA